MTTSPNAMNTEFGTIGRPSLERAPAATLVPSPAIGRYVTTTVVSVGP